MLFSFKALKCVAELFFKDLDERALSMTGKKPFRGP
jgi:hypothetical protein